MASSKSIKPVNNIGRIRRSLGVTQKNLALALGISTNAIAQLEVRKSPKYETLLKVGKVLGVSPEQLMGLALVCMLFTFLGCAASAPAALPVETKEVPVKTCAMVFYPEAGLEDVTVDMAARWSAATGCDLQVFSSDQEDAMPVFIHYEEIPDDNGQDVCGETNPIAQDGKLVGFEIVVNSLGCSASTEKTVMHEGGHAVASRNKFRKDDHIEGPNLMAPEDNDVVLITTADLVCICRDTLCTQFAPEA